MIASQSRAEIVPKEIVILWDLKREAQQKVPLPHRKQSIRRVFRSLRAMAFRDIYEFPWEYMMEDVSADQQVDPRPLLSTGKGCVEEDAEVSRDLIHFSNTRIEIIDL